MPRLVTYDKPVFVDGSVVPAGTPFEVPGDAKLEDGMAEFKGQKPARAAADPGQQSLSEITAQGGVGEPPPSGVAPAKAPAKSKA